jgi:uncharacterized protein (TIGR01777 family)
MGFIPAQPGPVAVIGATGFIGRALAGRLSAAGVSVTGVSRSAHMPVVGINRWQQLDRLDLAGHSAVINLAGEPIDRRWTAERKQRFHESRVGVTRRLVEHLGQLNHADRPEVLINGSAVGFYGDRGDEILEEEAVRGEGYLADLCQEWEAAALAAEELGMRVALLRTGVVLGKGGAAFEKLRRAFLTGLGGRLGSGRQWMPWIHLQDLTGAVLHVLETPELYGPVNGCAPQPERNANFTRKLAAALNRPALLPVPAFALKLALGGFGSALLASAHAVPSALERTGYVFRFPRLEEALGDLLT